MDSSTISNKHLTSEAKEGASTPIPSSYPFESEEIESISTPSLNGESTNLCHVLEDKIHHSHPSIPASSLKHTFIPTASNEETTEKLLKLPPIISEEETSTPSDLSAYSSNHNVTEYTSSFEFYFDIKMFEYHLRNATLHLRYGLSHSSSLSVTSSSGSSSFS